MQIVHKAPCPDSLTFCLRLTFIALHACAENTPEPRPTAQNFGVAPRILLEKFSCLVDVALFLLTTNPSSHRQDARHHQADVRRTPLYPHMRRVRNCDAAGPLNGKCLEASTLASVLRGVRNGPSECEAVRGGTLMLGETQHSRRRPMVAHRQTSSA